jgi:hypothetical protein
VRRGDRAKLGGVSLALVDRDDGDGTAILGPAQARLDDRRAALRDARPQ